MKNLNFFKSYLTRLRGLAVLILMLFAIGIGNAWGAETLKTTCVGTGSGYGTRRTATYDGIGWVLASGQSGYLGANSATNHNKVKPTNDDLPVVKAQNASATTSTTGYYFYYTSTAIANVTKIEFSYTGKTGSNTVNAYVVSSSTAAANGSETWSKPTLASGTGLSAQGANIASATGTYTFKLNAKETSSKYYGIILQTSSYSRLTAGSIKIYVDDAVAYTVVWTINPAAGGTLSTTSGTSTTVTPNSAYTYGSPAYTVTTGSASVVQSTNTFTATPTANCTIRINMVEKPKYTVTYNAGTGTCGTSTWTQTSAGQSTTLPSASPSAGCSANDWEFAGWCTSSAGNEDENTTSPGDILTGSYTPTGNITLYAVYTKSGSGGTSYTSVSASEVTAGTYVIAAIRSESASSTYYAATGEISSGDMVVESTGFTLTNGEFSTIPTGGIEFTFTGDNTDGFSINNGTGNLYYTTASSRKLDFQADNTRKWKIYDFTSPLNTNGVYIQNEDGNYTITENATSTTPIRGYASTTKYRAIYLFKKNSQTYYMTNLACSSCSYTVTLSKGSETNGTFTMTPAAGTRNNCTTGLEVTVSDISPNSGYEFVAVTESNGITPTDNGDGTYTIAYTADQSYTSTVGVTFRQKCATPTFSPGAGTYTSTQSVTISCATNDAVIHYTTNGSTPNASSPTYNGAITVSEDMTIKAIATRTNYGNSEVASAAYKILNCDWYESFNETNGTGGNDDIWSGTGVATASIEYDDSHAWTVTAGGGGDRCIKLGSSSAGGSAQTPVLTGLTGNLILSFRAAGWGGESPTISITTTSGDDPLPSSVDVTSSEWNSYEVVINNVETAPQITLSSTGGKNRFFLDDVCVKQGSSTYHVTYNANSGSGTAPTDNTDYARNSSVTVSGNTNLTKTGWTFAGWNTAADGSGTPYAAGNTFSITSNVTLYAMWTCTVTWSVNENTSACSPETITYDPSGNKVETVPTPDPSNYCGDVFVGWYTADCDSNTAPDGTFTNVAGSPNITGNTTFYAVFADYAAE